MKIHTDLPGSVEVAIYEAAHRLPGVYADTVGVGSRSRKGALILGLEGNGSRRNTGKYGASDEHAATWDEWGVVLAAVFATDPNAFAGSKSYPVYHDADHFHWATANRFLRGRILPIDTHPRHLWEYEGRCVVGTFDAYDCRKCSAHRRSVAYGHTWAELAA